MGKCERCGKQNPAEIHTCTPGYYFEKENTTGQTVYEQLGYIIEKSLGYIYGGKYTELVVSHVFGATTVSLGNEDYAINVSIHDLFSKDSGIMEFVERNKYKRRGLFDVEWGGPDIVDGHYMIMGPMTSEEKVKYFIENAIIPSQK